VFLQDFTLRSATFGSDDPLCLFGCFPRGNAVDVHLELSVGVFFRETYAKVDVKNGIVQLLQVVEVNAAIMFKQNVFVDKGKYPF